MRHHTLLSVVAATVTTAVFYQGCSDHRRRYYQEPEGLAIGPFRAKFFGADENEAQITSAQQLRLTNAVNYTREVYEHDWDFWVPAGIALHVYLKDTGHVPCGIPNGGGCYDPRIRTIKVISGPYDEVTYLYHELNHLRLFELRGDITHTDSSWQCANGPRNNRVYEEIRLARGWSDPDFRKFNKVTCDRFGEELPFPFIEP